jgi:hypothetical protein
VGGRGDDDLADGSGVVEHEAERALQPGDVELLRPAERHLLADGEEDLDAHRRRLATRRIAPRQLQDDRYGRLVVGAEDPVVGVLPSSVDEHRLHGGSQRHGVHVRAEQHALRRPPRDAGEQVAGLRADRRPALVLLHIEPQRAQLLGQPIGHAALVSRGALDAAQRRERLVEALAFRLGGAPHEAEPRETLTLGSSPSGKGSASAPDSARASAAPTNSRNSGAGRSGRDLNSGWYCEAT